MQSLSGTGGEESFAVQLSETLHHEQAIQLIDYALSRDPLNPRMIWSKMYILGNARMYTEALAVARSLLSVGAKRQPPHGFVGYYLMLLGRNDEAQSEFAQAGSSGFVVAWNAALAVRRGDMAKSRELLREMQAAAGDAAYYQVGQILAQQGRKGEAIEALMKALASRDPGLTEILVDAMLDPLRPEPRFQAFVRTLDFPTYQLAPANPLCHWALDAPRQSHSRRRMFPSHLHPARLLLWIVDPKSARGRADRTWYRDRPSGLNLADRPPPPKAISQTVLRPARSAGRGI
jgi:tetratricopeptide (TPR) repeat protein